MAHGGTGRARGREGGSGDGGGGEQGWGWVGWVRLGEQGDGEGAG